MKPHMCGVMVAQVEICFGNSEGVTKTNCETVDLMVDDIGDEVSRNDK